jgi:hypothetical protein
LGRAARSSKLPDEDVTLNKFHNSAYGRHVLETRGGKEQLEAREGCLLKAITNLLASEVAGWNKRMATCLGQAYCCRLVDWKAYIAAIHIQELPLDASHPSPAYNYLVEFFTLIAPETNSGMTSQFVHIRISEWKRDVKIVTDSRLRSRTTLSRLFKST